MVTDVIISGFGGQGILLASKTLAHAAMCEGKHVSWIPSYGPEMRGGAANCTVVISDEPIGSPVVARPRALLAMNRPSLDKFEPTLRAHGTLVINTSLAERSSTRSDLSVVDISANAIATELGNPRGANMVMLGAFLAVSPAVSIAALRTAVRDMCAGKSAIVESNLLALDKGYTLGRSYTRGPTS